jgi:phytanoyl-CoA dioxygenase PhyH
MNRVTPQTPLDETVALLNRDGYALMEDALSPQQIEALSTAYNRQLALHPPREGALRVEVPRILERDPVFELLMDLPTVLPVARAMIGPDIELASSGELDHKLPHTRAYIGWHNDFLWMANVPFPRQNFWVRCTYFLSDVTADMGPFTLLPGTHLADGAPPEEWNAGGQPREVEGQIGITGPAGSCLINNTEIWHTNSPNRSDRPRRLIMLLYKHAWMKQWQEGYETTPEFAARQTDPIRRQLCGHYVWHHGESHFPANELRRQGTG